VEYKDKRVLHLSIISTDPDRETVA